MQVIGRDRTLEIGKRAARLTGLQQYKHAADALGCVDGDVADAAAFLTSVLAGMGDTGDSDFGADRQSATVRQHGLRIVRGMTGDDRDIMLSCWTELWRGAVGSHRQFIDVRVEARDDTLTWHLALKGEQ